MFPTIKYHSGVDHGQEVGRNTSTQVYQRISSEGVLISAEFFATTQDASKMITLERLEINIQSSLNCTHMLVWWCIVTYQQNVNYRRGSLTCRQGRIKRSAVHCAVWRGLAPRRIASSFSVRRGTGVSRTRFSDCSLGFLPFIRMNNGRNLGFCQHLTCISNKKMYFFHKKDEMIEFVLNYQDRQTFYPDW